MVVMRRPGVFANSLDWKVDRKIRDLVRRGKGYVLIIRKTRIICIEIHLKLGGPERDWKNPKKPATAGNKMGVDQSVLVQNRHCTP